MNRTRFIFLASLLLLISIASSIGAQQRQAQFLQWGSTDVRYPRIAR